METFAAGLEAHNDMCQFVLNFLSFLSKLKTHLFNIAYLVACHPRIYE